MANSSAQLPAIAHPYQNHSMDSLRWNFFAPRTDDIVVATSYKAGTTWVQAIVANLIFAGELRGSIHSLCPWLDSRLFPLELVLTALEQQTHRRSIKTHLPLDSLPFHPGIKYLYVGRDPRDVFMSWWNFYGDFSPQLISAMNNTPGRMGDELPRCPDDIHELWRGWMTRGSYVTRRLPVRAAALALVTPGSSLTARATSAPSSGRSWKMSARTRRRPG